MSRQPARRRSKRSTEPGYAAVGRTHRGLVREANEDAWLARPERGLFAVIDGMGGTRAGAKAARLARDAIEAKPIRTSAELRWSFERAHETIRRHAEAHPEDQGLGCVATAALVRGSRLTLAHVGDTRAYLATRAGCERLTRDHTVVAELEERHVMTEAAADSLPGRHRVTRDLGSGARLGSAWIDIGEGEIGPGDLLLLASDGLTDLIDDGEIGRHLGRARDDPEADLDRVAERLIELTLERGARDNVTVVVVRRSSDPPTEDTETISLPVPVARPATIAVAAPPRRFPWLLALAVGLGSLALGGAIGWLSRDLPALRKSHPAAAAPERPLAERLAGTFESATAITATEPVELATAELTTRLAADVPVILHGLDLRFAPPDATWTVRVGTQAELIVRQASLRAADARLVARLDTGARLVIADSHLAIGTLHATGAADAVVEVRGGHFSTALGPPTSEGPTVRIDGVVAAAGTAEPEDGPAPPDDPVAPEVSPPEDKPPEDSAPPDGRVPPDRAP